MADNTTLPGAGEIISTDELGGSVKVQRVKVQYGPDGTATDASKTTQLPVTDYNQTPSGGNITVQDTGSTVVTTGQYGSTIITGSPTASSTKDFAVDSRQSVTFQLAQGVGWTGTIEFEVSFDGGTTYYPLSLNVQNTDRRTHQATAAGAFSGSCVGATNVRARAASAITGTVGVIAVFMGTTAEPLRAVTPNSGSHPGNFTSTSSGTLIAANPARKCVIVQNLPTSTGTLYIDTLGGTASATNATLALLPGMVAELEVAKYGTGLFTAIHSATGSALVTETT